GEHRKEILGLQKQGFQRVKIDGEVYEIAKMPEIDKNKKHNIEVVVDRIVLSDELGNRLPDSIETALKLSDGLLLVEIVGLPEGKTEAKAEGKTKTEGKKGKVVSEDKVGDIITLSSKVACPISGFTLNEIEPRIFSFNSPFGACKACDGLGTEMMFDPDLVVPDTSISLYDKCIAPWSGTASKYFIQTLEGLGRHYKFSVHKSFRELPEDIKHIILYGSGEEIIKINYNDGVRTFLSNKPFEGVIPNLERRMKEAESDNAREELNKYQQITHCEECSGYRLNREALCVKVGELHIGEVCKLTIENSLKWFGELNKKLSRKHQKIAEKILKEIIDRLGFLNNVGLDYLTLSRESGTLSGGESQRIRLA
ncbi:MAG: excinuclease ABC subunit A, partial [Pseudomonadota bacterium]